MIEFRLHKGRQQFRTWVVDVDLDGSLRMSGHIIMWTEWRDVPIAPSHPYKVDAENKNITPYRAMFCRHEYEDVEIIGDRAFCKKCKAEL